MILPGLLDADDIILCGESEEDLKAILELFVEVCRKKGRKVNADEINVIVLGVEKGLKWEICVDGV